jgi:hypothetical protein
MAKYDPAETGSRGAGGADLGPSGHQRWPSVTDEDCEAGGVGEMGGIGGDCRGGRGRGEGGAGRGGPVGPGGAGRGEGRTRGRRLWPAGAGQG